MERARQQGTGYGAAAVARARFLRYRRLVAAARRPTPKRRAAATAPGADVPGPFARAQAVVASVPRGRVVTYGQVSLAIDRALTPIGVGWAMRAAPEGALPWHRVVNASGGVSTDAEHAGLQRSLLEAEGVRFDRGGRIDLVRYGWAPSAEAATPRRKRSSTSRS